MTTTDARRQFEAVAGPISGYAWRKAVRLYRAKPMTDDVWDGLKRRSIYGPSREREPWDWSEIGALVAAYNVFERPIPLTLIARRLALRGYDVRLGDVQEVVRMRAGQDYVVRCAGAI